MPKEKQNKKIMTTELQQLYQAVHRKLLIKFHKSDNTENNNYLCDKDSMSFVYSFKKNKIKKIIAKFQNFFFKENISSHKLLFVHIIIQWQFCTH